MDTIALIAAAVNLVVLAGFAWWIVGWLRSLKAAVDAQKETIAAQKEFIQVLKPVLDATDTPKMLERIESLKKLFDYEKEALQQALKIVSEQHSRVKALVELDKALIERLSELKEKK